MKTVIITLGLLVILAVFFVEATPETERTERVARSPQIPEPLSQILTTILGLLSAIGSIVGK